MKSSNCKIWCGLLLIILVISSGCFNNDIDPYNLLDDSKSPDDPVIIYNIAGSSFRNLHNVIQGERSVALATGVMADHVTCYWPDYAIRELSLEPRITSFNNQLDYEYRFITEDMWSGAYKANADANLVLQKLYGGMNFGLEGEDNRLVEAFAWFVNGVAHGYIGLIFDQGAIVKWDSDLNNISLCPWQDVVDQSLLMLERAIEIAGIDSFTVPDEWVAGQAMTNVEFLQLASSWAARLLSYSPRREEQSLAIDWNRVLYYAQNGLEADFAPTLGDTYGWFDGFHFFSTYPGWGRVDMRILNLMDHDYPSRYPADGVSWNTPDGEYPGYPQPGDNRLNTDFIFQMDSNFPLIYYMYSQYRYIRYEDALEVRFGESVAKPSFLAWEVRLLEAEALFRTGDSDGALAILNVPAGPRKVRGGLPDITPGEDILRLILDEKEIECYLTGAGVSFFDMRRTDRLQPGTLLHFPVPATELLIMGLPNYTINAVADGVQASAGGWTGWDE